MATYTTQQAPLPWMEDYLKDYVGRARDVSSTGYTQSPSQVAPLNPYLQQGWRATANRAVQGSPVMGAANQNAQDVLSGKFLDPNSNPYLTGAINQAQGDLARNYNQVQAPAWDRSMQQSGSFENTGVAEAASFDRNNLMQNMGRIGQDMRLGAYNTERGYQQQALGMAPGLANQDYVDANALTATGQQAQAYQDKGAAQDYNWWQEQQNYPARQLGIYGQALGIGGQGMTKTENSPDPSMGAQLLGGGLAGATLFNILFPPPKG